MGDSPKASELLPLIPKHEILSKSLALNTLALTDYRQFTLSAKRSLTRSASV